MPQRAHPGAAHDSDASQARQLWLWLLELSPDMAQELWPEYASAFLDHLSHE
jgi:hypothetical protein